MAGDPGVTIGWVKALAAQVLGAPVVEFSAPGGTKRRSLRLHLADGRAVIATRRETLARAEHEAAFLTGLNRLGAPVPQVYGFAEGVLFQQDVGGVRLSQRLLAGGAQAQKDAVAAVTALEDIRARVEAVPDLMAKLPGLGGTSWAEDFVARPFLLSGQLGIARPAVDASALVAALDCPPARFTRWDARAGNAAVQPDGTVLWYDWEIFGRRSGVEDIAWLIADDFWTLDRAATEGVLAGVSGPVARVPLMAVLIVANRLRLVLAAVQSDGWIPQEEALRLDRVGADADVLRRVVAQARGWAAQDALTAGFVPWFDAALEALLTR